VVPCLEGPWGELLGRLSLEPAAWMRQVDQSRLPPSEGWVLQAVDGMRTKLVSAEYTRARSAVAHMHPLTVWDRVRCGGWSQHALIASVPAHFRGETQGILNALYDDFRFVRRELEQQLQLTKGERSERKGQLLELLNCPAAGPVEGRAEKLEQLYAVLADNQRVQDSPVATVPDAPRGSTVDWATSNDDTLQAADNTSRPASLGSDRAIPSQQLRSRREALHQSPLFHSALRYVLQKGSADVGSMYLDPNYDLDRDDYAYDYEYDFYSGDSEDVSSIATTTIWDPSTGKWESARVPPLLRSLVLDCIRPRQDGTLPGYTPSPGMAWSHAKSWKWGPADERMVRITSALPAATSVLRDEDLVEALLRLEGRQLVEAQLVCKAWQRLLLGDPRYAPKVLLAEEEASEPDYDFDVDYDEWRQDEPPSDDYYSD
jgi:hypothetical protein